MAQPDTTAGNPRVSLTGYATASAWAHFGFDYADWFDSRRGRALFLPLHYGCRALRPIAPAAGAFSETLYWLCGESPTDTPSALYCTTAGLPSASM